MSWWMRSGTRAERLAAPRRGRAWSRGSCRRGDRSTSSRPACAASSIAAVIIPGARRERESPRRLAARARRRIVDAARRPAARSGTLPHSAAPCTPLWPRIGMRPVCGAAEHAARERQVDDGRDVLDPEAMLRDAHAPDEDGAPRGGVERREALHLGARHARLALEERPVLRRRARRASSAKPVVCAAMNASSTAPRASSAFRTPFAKARSPPIVTGKNSSMSAVPKTALRATDGTQ